MPRSLLTPVNTPGFGLVGLECRGFKRLAPIHWRPHPGENESRQRSGADDIAVDNLPPDWAELAVGYDAYQGARVA